MRRKAKGKIKQVPPPLVEQASVPLSYEEYKEINDKYIDFTAAQLEQLTERHTSSIQELDKQIIALAGGGLALTITLAKDVLSKGPANTEWALYCCWGCFLVALIINMISYRVSAHHYNLMIGRMGHYNDSAIFRRPVDTILRDDLSLRINRISPVVNWLNSIALFSCVAGIILFLIFMMHNQNHDKSNGKARPAQAASASNTHTRPHQKPSGNLRTTKPGTTFGPAAPHASASSSNRSSVEGGRVIPQSDNKKLPMEKNPSSRAPKRAPGQNSAAPTKVMLNPPLPPVPVPRPATPATVTGQKK